MLIVSLVISFSVTRFFDLVASASNVYQRANFHLILWQLHHLFVVTQKKLISA